MSFRRARIKASSAHLAALAGKRRVGQQNEEAAKPKNDEIVTEKAPTEKASVPEKLPEESPQVPLEKSKSNTSKDDVATEPNSKVEAAESSKNAENKDVSNEDNHGKQDKVLPEKPRLKSRFRPNLSEADQQRGRLRRISGCEYPGSPNPLTPGKISQLFRQKIHRFINSDIHRSCQNYFRDK